LLRQGCVPVRAGFGRFQVAMGRLAGSVCCLT
jgi:hypothetical protein